MDYVLVIPLEKVWGPEAREAAAESRRRNAARRQGGTTGAAAAPGADESGLTHFTTSTPGQAEEAGGGGATLVVPVTTVASAEDHIRTQRARTRQDRKDASTVRHAQTLTNHGVAAFRHRFGAEPTDAEREAIAVRANSQATHRRLAQRNRDVMENVARTVGRNSGRPIANWGSMPSAGSDQAVRSVISAALTAHRDPASAAQAPSAVSSAASAATAARPARGGIPEDFRARWVNDPETPHTYQKVLGTKGAEVPSVAEFETAITGGLTPEDAKLTGRSTSLSWEGKLLDSKGNLVVENLTRTFYKRDNGDFEVRHDYFKVADNAAAQGAGKQVLRSQMDLYKKLGVDYVTTYANINVGKYAWAKYGFLPENQGQWDTIRNNYKYLLQNSPAFRSVTPEQKADALTILNNPDKRAAWAFADLKTPFPGKDPKTGETTASTLGKELMLRGNSWDGKLDLHDEATTKRFDNYVAQKPKPKLVVPV